MEKEGKVKFNIFKLILKILYNILIIFCVILIAIILMQKVTDSNRSIAGFRMFRVLTGSMVPKYDVGEVVVCREVAPEEIEIGDSIVYRGDTGQFRNKAIMHEVIGIDIDESQNRIFHVKGIANNEEDPEVTVNQVYGVVICKSPILTLLYKLATSIFSAFIIITLLVINVFISFKGSPKENIERLENKELNEKINNKKDIEDDKEEKDENDSDEGTLK